MKICENPADGAICGWDSARLRPLGVSPTTCTALSASCKYASWRNCGDSLLRLCWFLLTTFDDLNWQSTKTKVTWRVNHLGVASLAYLRSEAILVWSKTNSWRCIFLRNRVVFRFFHDIPWLSIPSSMWRKAPLGHCSCPPNGAKRKRNFRWRTRARRHQRGAALHPGQGKSPRSLGSSTYLQSIVAQRWKNDANHAPWGPGSGWEKSDMHQQIKICSLPIRQKRWCDRFEETGFFFTWRNEKVSGADLYTLLSRCVCVWNIWTDVKFLPDDVDFCCSFGFRFFDFSPLDALSTSTAVSMSISTLEQGGNLVSIAGCQTKRAMTRLIWSLINSTYLLHFFAMGNGQPKNHLAGFKQPVFNFLGLHSFRNLNFHCQ